MKVATRGARIIANREVEWIPLGRLFVDPDVQRPLDERAAQKIADALDLSVIGLIEVSARSNNLFHITDGQTRVAALRLFGFNPDDLVPCLVERNLSRAEEAHRFDGRNTARAVRAFDRFRVRLKAEDPTALGVDAILMRHGWRVQTGDTSGAFTAVVAAEQVYTGYGSTNKENGPQNLSDALGTVTEAWGREPRSANGAIISGLGLFFAKYGNDIDKPGLVRRLAKFPGGPDKYLGTARGIREFRGGVMSRCVAELTVEIYNKRRSSGSTLPDWRS